MQQTHPAWLVELGWDDGFQESLAGLGDPDFQPVRVAADHGAGLIVHGATGVGPAGLARSVREAGRNVAVGDWAAVRPGAPPEIADVLPRRSAIRRKLPDAEVRGQVLAANVDVAFVVAALDGDVNPRRIERMLMAIHQSGAAPVVLLTKSDAVTAGAALAQVASLAAAAPVLSVSNVTGEGLDEVRGHLGPGRTAVLLGSSGVGKTSLVNRLAGGTSLRTGGLHHSGQGRHTTSHRQLILLPGGGIVIDTPGLRELQLWTGDEGLDGVFGDIEDLARTCRFADCSHTSEPGCAIRAALEAGRLDPARWRSQQKLARELHAIEARSDQRLKVDARRLWRARQRQAREDVAVKRGRL